MSRAQEEFINRAMVAIRMARSLDSRNIWGSQGVYNDSRDSRMTTVIINRVAASCRGRKDFRSVRFNHAYEKWVRFVSHRQEEGNRVALSTDLFAATYYILLDSTVFSGLLNVERDYLSAYEPVLSEFDRLRGEATAVLAG